MGEAFDLDSRNRPRGASFTARLSPEVAGRDDLRLELLLVERKVGITFDHKVNHARVVATVTDVSPSTAIPIPVDLPDAYLGTSVGWDYEVRLAVDRLGSDTIATIPVEIVDDVRPGDGHTEGVQALGSPGGSRATSKAPIINPVPVDVVMVVALALTVAVSGYFAIAVPVYPLLIVTGGAGILLVALATAERDRRRYQIAGLACVPPTEPITRGRPFAVSVVGGAGHELEVGLSATELVVTSNGKRNVAIPTVVVERWTRLLGSSHSFTIGADEPMSYAGQEVAVRWAVTVRPTAPPEKHRGAASHTVALLVGPPAGHAPHPTPR